MWPSDSNIGQLETIATTVATTMMMTSIEKKKGKSENATTHFHSSLPINNNSKMIEHDYNKQTLILLCLVFGMFDVVRGGSDDGTAVPARAPAK